jgi:hypothetical protein
MVTVDAHRFVKIWVQGVSQLPSQLFDEDLHQLMLTVSIADEARMLKGHIDPCEAPPPTQHVM